VGVTSAAVGIHHNDGANVLFNGGHARNLRIDKIVPNFYNAASSVDLTTLAARRIID
jgi:prepilin-type processing-associated H-X9-DG protein